MITRLVLLLIIVELDKHKNGSRTEPCGSQLDHALSSFRTKIYDIEDNVV